MFAGTVIVKYAASPVCACDSITVCWPCSRSLATRIMISGQVQVVARHPVRTMTMTNRT